jgi:hypothetical protein
MARGLAREQSKAKNLKKSAGGKKQDDSGLTPQQRNERCARKWLTGSSTGCCIRVAPAAWSSLFGPVPDSGILRRRRRDALAQAEKKKRKEEQKAAVRCHPCLGTRTRTRTRSSRDDESTISIAPSTVRGH